MMNGTQWDLNSPEVAKTLCNKFKHTRMSKMKSAGNIAESAGISELDLHLIEAGQTEKLTPIVAENIALALGLIQSPMLEVKNEPKEQVEMRKHKGRHKISPARKRQGREIKERRKALGIAMHELETEANLPKWCLSQMESKGVGLFPDRAAATFEALERLEARKEKYKNGTNYNPLTKQMDNSHKEATPPMSTHQASPSKPRRTGFTISTEHKIKCGEHTQSLAKRCTEVAR